LSISGYHSDCLFRQLASLQARNTLFNSKDLLKAGIAGVLNLNHCKNRYYARYCWCASETKARTRSWSLLPRGYNLRLSSRK